MAPEREKFDAPVAIFDSGRILHRRLEFLMLTRYDAYAAYAKYALACLFLIYLWAPLCSSCPCRAHARE